ncbi:MAG TPA: DUF1810 family protein [Vicinamibacterales bacterium]|nr:DUF1810 family protein [Vicinamibacterales bacterium]
MSGLNRFKEAQDDPHAGFESAIAELRAGHKQGHWIWYIFPQLSGLGVSSLSRLYGINGRVEAREYLEDGLLRSRLLTVTETVAARLKEGTPVRVLMGSSVDAQKLVSSLTLFGEVSKELSAAGALGAGSPVEAREGRGASTPSSEYEFLGRAAAAVLAVTEQEGFPPCRFTLAALKG